MKNGLKILNDNTKYMHFCQIHKMHNHSALILKNSELPITYQHKFLGITLDSKLYFIPHIKQLWIKCNYTIQFLKAIAHTDRGADKKILIKSYRSLICSKLDYGCFIYEAARKSDLRELDTRDSKSP